MTPHNYGRNKENNDKNNRTNSNLKNTIKRIQRLRIEQNIDIYRGFIENKMQYLAQKRDIIRTSCNKLKITGKI